MRRIKICFVILFLLVCSISFAQVIPYLERKVSINVTNQTYVFVFDKISVQTETNFSYNPKEFNDSKKISVNHTSISLRLLLDEISKGTGFNYKVKKNYIILYSSSENTIQQIRGYVYSKADSAIISEASIYNLKEKKSTLSNEYGYFSISINKQKDPFTLNIAKENFEDTAITFMPTLQKNIVIYIAPQKIEVIVPDTFESAVLRDLTILKNGLTFEEEKKKKNDFISTWLNRKKSRPNQRNISKTLYSNFSISLVPFLSTNKLLSINTQNKFSFNILVGNSKGVKAAEIGGLINVDNGKVSYAQAAGIGNVVSDNVNGLQVGGIFNVVQKKVRGLQAGGIFNYSGSFQGLQTGGIFNHNKGKAQGAQIAGVFNLSDTIKGAQIAGLINKARYTTGVQLAGFLNRSKVIKGFQLALINLSDTCKGVPIGLFSFVKHGYHKLEIASTESQLITLGFRTGVEHFHNIFFSGVNAAKQPKYFTYGYGLGSSFKLTKHFFLGMDITSQQIQAIEASQLYLSLLNKAQVNFEFAILKRLRVAIGPSFNIMTIDYQNPYYSDISAFFKPRPFFNENSPYSFFATKMWLGAAASIKLF